MKDNLIKKISLFLGGLALLMSLGFIILSLNQRLAVRKRGEVTKEAQGADLSLSPAGGTKKLGEALQVDIIIDAGDFSVRGADVFLRFEPKKLKVINVTPGDLFEKVFYNQTHQQEGKIILSASSIAKTFNGSGKYGRVEFLTLKPGLTKVWFDVRQSKITQAQSEGPNILKKVENGDYIIQ